MVLPVVDVVVVLPVVDVVVVLPVVVVEAVVGLSRAVAYKVIQIRCKVLKQFVSIFRLPCLFYNLRVRKQNKNENKNKNKNNNQSYSKILMK